MATPEQWQRVEETFYAALELGREERAVFITARCHGDQELLQEVASLLRAHDEAEAGVETDAEADSETTADADADAGPAGSQAVTFPPAEFPGNARFRVLARLGEGGFGIVYRVFDEQQRRDVALKLLRQPDGDGVYRFKREFRSLAEIFHPNLVELHELFFEDGQWFFTMERVEGRPFVEHVRAAGAEQVAARLREVLPQTIDGILALHRAGRLHRDLKPHNVLITQDGRVKILDFGLVADLQPDAGQTPGVAGTPAYMAPETLCRRSCQASDWYSLGAMVYECLAAEPPFTGELLEILTRKGTHEPTPLAVQHPSVLPEWDALCRDLLRIDPALRPGGEEILRRLGTLGGPPSAPPLVRGDLRSFVGRQERLEALDRAFARCQQGQLAVVEVQGPSGIGKSTLVRKFLADAGSASEAIVISGRCYEQESVPFKAVDSLIDGISRYLGGLPAEEVDAVLPREVAALVRLFPVLGRIDAIRSARRRTRLEVDPVELRRKGATALRELLIRISERQPLVLWLDDLQWGDADSLSLLRELLRPPDPPALLLIACLTSGGGDLTEFPQAWDTVLADCPQVVRLELTVLSVAESTALAASLLADRGDTVMASRIAEESVGNPMLIALLVRQALRGGTVHIEDAVQAEWDQQPEEAHRLLRILAVSGQPLPLDALMEAAEVPLGHRSPVETLRREGLVRLQGGAGESTAEVCHRGIRDAVLASLSTDDAHAHRRRLAETLERRGRYDPEMLAHLYLACHEPTRAAPHAAVAADQAAQALAFDRAVRLYRVALDAPLSSHEADRLRRLLAGALANAGRGREAAVVYQALAEPATEPESTELRLRAANEFLRAGHVDDGLALVRSVLKAVGLRLPRTTWGAALSFLAQSVWLNLRGFAFEERAQTPGRHALRLRTCGAVSEGLAWIDTVRAADFTARYTRLALKAGDAFAVGRGLATLGAFWGFSSLRPAWSRRALRVASSLGRRRRDPRVLSTTRLAAGVAAYGQGRFADCRRHCARALVHQDKTGARGWERNSAEVLIFSSLIYLGQWAALRPRLPALLEDAEARGDLFMKTHLLTRQYVMAHLTEDTPAAASQAVERAMAAWSQTGFHLQHYWELAARMEIALYTGQAAATWTEVSRGWSALRRSSVAHNQVLRVEASFLRGRLALAARPLLQEDAWRWAARDARDIEGRGALWARPMAWMLQASVAAARGDRPRSASLLADAAAALEARDLTIFAAVCRRRRAQLDGPEGHARVQEADAVMARQGIRRPDRIADLYVPWI